LGIEAGEPPTDRFAALHGLYWLCANRAERGPLAMAIDDVQWIDVPSLAWLGYLARRTGDLPLVLVLGLRSSDPVARAELERALDGAHHCGARRIAAKSRAELIAAGAKPRRDAITGRDALTAGELRVARLAAQGLTNRDIAQALFITTKTAKAHLNRVYRKLDITRRGQLADALNSSLDDARRNSSATTAIS
jgi:DNA-binding CsgD family transcriptional regulator